MALEEVLPIMEEEISSCLVLLFLGIAADITAKGIDRGRLLLEMAEVNSNLPNVFFIDPLGVGHDLL